MEPLTFESTASLQGVEEWLDSVAIRTSDSWSTGWEFDSRPCTVGLVLGWVTVGGRVKHLGM